MANKTIDQLTPAVAALLTHEFEIYDPAAAPGSKSQMVTGQQIHDLFSTPDVTLDIPLDNSHSQFFAAHGLSATPRLVRAVFVCILAAGGYNVDDEMEVHSIATGTSPRNPPAVSADATNCYLSLYQNINNGSAWLNCKKAGGGMWNFTHLNWSLRFYVWA